MASTRTLKALVSWQCESVSINKFKTRPVPVPWLGDDAGCTIRPFYAPPIISKPRN